jgi:hypothetical protein
VQILIISPQSWSVKKKQVAASNYMCRKAEELVLVKGIPSTTNPKPGKMLKDDSVKPVHEFHDDEICRCMLGKKIFCTCKRTWKKSHAQKLLLPCNLNEAYSLFKQWYPNVKVEFSKFCEIRPRNIVTAGACGTHSVCICSTHQNVKLMLPGCKLKELTAGSSTEITSYKDCLSRITCNPSIPECQLRVL